MRIIKVFKDGTQIVGDSLAMITPHGLELKEELDLSTLTDEEFEEVKLNPSIILTKHIGKDTIEKMKGKNERS